METVEGLGEYGDDTNPNEVSLMIVTAITQNTKALERIAEVIEAKSDQILSELASIEHNTDGPVG